MAFYKLDGDGVTLLCGENFVYSPVVTLTKETKDEFTYPQDGWYWFDTEDEAKSFYGIKDNNGL